MNRKVLIIDDEEDLCMMVNKFLTGRNYDVFSAYSIADGLKKLHEIIPDSLLLDNNLPDGLGWIQASALHVQYPLMHITLISANSIFPLEFTGNQFTMMEKPISLATLEQYL
ncbi:MAG: response regulator [Bacteroidota bacterium]